MKKIELYKSSQKDFDETCNDYTIESLVISGSKIKDYSNLTHLKNLKELKLISLKYGTNELLHYISALRKLEKLSLFDVPKITVLDPLSKVKNLKELNIESLPSWDALGKTLVIENLDALSELKKLEKIYFMKVKVKNNGLKPLYQSNNLITFETENLFSIEDFAGMAKNLKDTNCKYFVPYNEVPYSKCKKCNSIRVKLTGLEKRNLVCPNCQNKKIKEHEEKFNKIKNS